MSTLVPAPTFVPAVTTYIKPAETPRELVVTCKPDYPLPRGDSRWEDFSPARGNAAVEALSTALTLRSPSRFIHAAFIGHRGAGKTTEILRLADDVREGYELVYIEATDEMDLFVIEVEDLLFNIALAVESTMRERGTPLPKELLEETRRWFEEVVQTTKYVQGFNAEAAAGFETKVSSPFFGGLFGSLKALFKHESEYRTEIRHVLRRYPGRLLANVNALLDEANKLLEGRSLLIVVDNLDRYTPEVADNLLGISADRLRQLRCNLILTPPMSLLLQPRSTQLERTYECHFLQAIQLRKPEQRYHEFDGPGRDLMEEALSRRVNLDKMIPAKAARDRLISASGGMMRELLDLVYQSILLARSGIITEAVVDNVARQRRQRQRDLINANGWMETLVQIALHKQIRDDAKCMAVLFNYLAFKYNGEGWYDIHPLVDEIPQFQVALRDAR